MVTLRGLAGRCGLVLHSDVTFSILSRNATSELEHCGMPKPPVIEAHQIRNAGHGGYRADARRDVALLTSLVAYRGLDAHSPLFLTGEGTPFTFTRRVKPTGAISYSGETLTEIYQRLHQPAGIPNGNVSAARRTFAVTPHRQGRSTSPLKPCGRYATGWRRHFCIRRWVERAVGVGGRTRTLPFTIQTKLGFLRKMFHREAFALCGRKM